MLYFLDLDSKAQYPCLGILHLQLMCPPLHLGDEQLPLVNELVSRHHNMYQEQLNGMCLHAAGVKQGLVNSPVEEVITKC